MARMDGRATYQEIGNGRVLKSPRALSVIVSALVLLGPAAVASMLPAARAAGVEVISALRSE